MKNVGLFGIPTMDVPSAKGAKANLRGSNNYVVEIKETSKKDYENYLADLADCGFEKFADNGEGLDNAVFNTTLVRGEEILIVTYLGRTETTCISYYQGEPVSERLIYKDSYAADIKEGAQTKLYMMELWYSGNSFVIQLKNGHFLISDGGTWNEVRYLLDFMESKVPEGEKPIVEGWFYTHGHGDHMGVAIEFIDCPELANRVLVEGFYYNSPSRHVEDLCQYCNANWRIRKAADLFRTPTGEHTPVYTPQTGQRYYFCDITMDILVSQEQNPFSVYKRDYDINNASTVCLLNIEGQKVFLSGDIHEFGLQFIMNNLSQEFMHLTAFTLNHHGFNTYNPFTDYCEIDTLLVTSPGITPLRTRRDVKYLKESVKEWMHWGDGTIEMTFPYKVGEYKVLPKFDWIYHKEDPRPWDDTPSFASTLFTIPGRRFLGFIFEAEDTLFEGDKLQEGALRLLQLLKDNKVHTSVYSPKTTEELSAWLKEAGIYEYFDLVLGSDQLDKDDLYRDALLKSEEAFNLEHVHNILVLCHDLKTLNPAIEEGFRCLIVNKDAANDIRSRAARGPINCLNDFFDLMEKQQYLFEGLKKYPLF